MSDSTPVVLKKRKLSQLEDADVSRFCIVHYSRNIKDTQVNCLSEKTFLSIQHSKSVRQSQINPTVRLDDICCHIPTIFNAENHGCHTWCYSNFTNTSRLKVDVNQSNPLATDELKTPTLPVPRTSNRCPSDSNTPKSRILFQKNVCIFCGLGRRKFKSILEGLTVCVTDCAQALIVKCAQKKNDFRLLGKISGIDMKAREAPYHATCRRSVSKHRLRWVLF